MSDRLETTSKEVAHLLRDMPKSKARAVLLEAEKRVSEKQAYITAKTARTEAEIERLEASLAEKETEKAVLEGELEKIYRDEANTYFRDDVTQADIESYVEDRKMAENLKMSSQTTYFHSYLDIAGGNLEHQKRLEMDGLWRFPLSESEYPIRARATMIAMRPKMLEQCHPFFLTGRLFAAGVHPAPQEPGFLLDTPFKCVWVERSDGLPLFTFREEGELATKVLGALIYEKNTSAYMAEVFVRHAGEETIRLVTTAFLPSMFEGKSDTAFLSCALHSGFYLLFKRFKKECAFAEEKIPAIRAVRHRDGPDSSVAPSPDSR